VIESSFVLKMILAALIAGKKAVIAAFIAVITAAGVRKFLGRKPSKAGS